eukprot:CAMPEP_0194194072 /NCGR_PEP_ID=MMETSP0154-20130528/75381_1 /TAXON_ID=1049557 /ORGANISM="Thalassiothrix antarctica, Strain L6-D1" /LENGTH=52 /DNA_ID=CAMNT_0038918463 /DNA_START=777 /DNA_END=935 /DNA_ORIENTATION=+
MIEKGFERKTEDEIVVMKAVKNHEKEEEDLQRLRDAEIRRMEREAKLNVQDL